MIMLKNSSLILILLAIFFHTAVDASDLKINSIRIYFSNDRPEITVKRNRTYGCGSIAGPLGSG
jgi:hypothetical protein